MFGLQCTHVPPHIWICICALCITHIDENENKCSLDWPIYDKKNSGEKPIISIIYKEGIKIFCRKTEERTEKIAWLVKHRESQNSTMEQETLFRSYPEKPEFFNEHGLLTDTLRSSANFIYQALGHSLSCIQVFKNHILNFNVSVQIHSKGRKVTG